MYQRLSVRLLRQAPTVTKDQVLAATLGSFDGFHRGHQALLQVVRREKDRLSGLGYAAKAAVFSFYPHPAVALGRAFPPRSIMTLRQKLLLLATEEIDYFVLLRFTRQLAAMPATDFLGEKLWSQYQVRSLTIGTDAKLGAGREAAAEGIQAIFRGLGGDCRIISPVQDGAAKISSGTIRTLLEQGAVAKAAALLGRPVTLDGRVVPGDSRGRSLGYPTANLYCRQLLPALGVYAGLAAWEGNSYAAVVNIGHRPTFGGGHVTVEAHLLDYQGARLYGKLVVFELWEHLRTERMFPDAAALQAQIAKDVRRCRELFPDRGRV